MRKTKKYFRDKVNLGILSAIEVLPEIVSYYGKNPKSCRGRKYVNVKTDLGWNHQITGFSFYKKDLYIDVYWQGDDTDGDSSIKFVPGKINYVIPAEHYFDGIRTRTTHSDIIVNSGELYDAIKILVNSL